MSDKFEIIDNGDAAISVIFSDPIGESLSEKIIYLAHALQSDFNEQILEAIPAYQSLTICFDPLTDTKLLLTKRIKHLVKNYKSAHIYQSRTIEIPVCYEEEFALDLNKVSERCGLSTNEIVRLHCEQTYLVHMLGFSPGFLYLGGLNPKLHCQRKATPSLRVPAGSVGIGGSQTGIYPQDTPGGWQIIGRTPINLFNPLKTNPFVANPLDKIQFVPIDKETFFRLLEDTA